MKISPRTRNYIYFGLFMAFIAVSFLLKYEPGVAMGNNFYLFAKDMVLILPPAFILIGLFDVWAKREVIEKHFGETAGARGFVWSILLAATTVGGTFVAFPVANALYHKGARYSMIMTYITAASLVMIPMSIMEAAILGPKFTAVRILVSLPLVVIGSIFIEKLLLRMKYRIPEVQEVQK
ncbi:MAG: permease [Spirochaetia bacterium]